MRRQGSGRRKPAAEIVASGHAGRAGAMARPNGQVGGGGRRGRHAALDAEKGPDADEDGEGEESANKPKLTVKQTMVEMFNNGEF